MIAPLQGATCHLVGIGVALAIALNAISATAGEHPKVFLSPLSTSLEPIKVRIGEYRMAIPEAYLDAPIEQDERAETMLTEDRFYDTSGVFMVAELPDLTPRTETSMREWLVHRGWKVSRWVNVLLQQRKLGMAGPSDVMFRIYSGASTWGENFEAKGELFGLQWLAHYRAHKDNFVKFDNGERVVFITCHQEGLWCSQFIRVRPGLQATITYGRQYLPRWAEIEAKVRDLIDGFIYAVE